MDQTPNPGDKTYAFTIRVLGNEVLSIGLSSSSDSNKWVAIGLISIFSLLTILGAYGDKLVGLFHRLTNF